MARTKIKETFLKDWDGVDLTLKEIAEHKQAILRLEADMNERIDEIKLAESIESAPHQEAIKVLGARLKEFTTEHKFELKDKRTRELTFGRLGFRQSTKIVISNAADTIQKLLKLNMDDCVTVKQSINKDNLKKYNSATLSKVGASFSTSDTFWYETKQERLDADE